MQTCKNARRATPELQGEIPRLISPAQGAVHVARAGACHLPQTQMPMQELVRVSNVARFAPRRSHTQTEYTFLCLPGWSKLSCLQWIFPPQWLGSCRQRRYGDRWCSFAPSEMVSRPDVEFLSTTGRLVWLQVRHGFRMAVGDIFTDKLAATGSRTVCHTIDLFESNHRRLFLDLQLAHVQHQRTMQPDRRPLGRLATV